MSPLGVAAQQENVKWFNSESGDMHSHTITGEAGGCRHGSKVNLGVEMWGGVDFNSAESPPCKINTCQITNSYYG